jgi:hypothetical protein
MLFLVGMAWLKDHQDCEDQILGRRKKQRNVSKLRPEPLNSTIILGKQ